jgi:putative ABC transport system permease protein
MGASLVIVVGMALVVAVTISILSLSSGYVRMIQSSARPDRAIILSQGSQYEFASAIPRESVIAIASAPGVRLTPAGVPVLSAESLASVVLSKKSNGLDAYVVLRGIGPEGFALRPEIKLISGRMFTPGKHELIVGKWALAQYEGMDVGNRVPLVDGDWTITGSFESNGEKFESALLADSETVLAALRGKSFHSITVLLDRQDAFERVREALITNPALTVDVRRETEFFATQTRDLNRFLTSVACIVGAIMGLGATFGALNTMYSTVSARSIEIATLRAIGFGGGSVVASILAEALVLAFSGAVIGAGIAWLAFNGNFHAAGGLVFRLAVTPTLIALGVGLACTLGFLGGLFPAIRAARLPVATVLRGT